MDDIRLVSVRDFEKEVADLIIPFLGEDEEIEYNHLLGGSRSFVDLFLKNGCKRLGLSSNTAIEIKYRLTTDIGAWILTKYKVDLDSCGVRLLIICKENFVEDFLHSNKPRIQGRATIWNYAKLVKKTKESKLTDIPETRIVHIKDELESAKEVAKVNKISLFLGAGVSIDANLPSWDTLLKELLKQKEGRPFKYINEANASAISDSLGNSQIVSGRYISEGYRKAIKDAEKGLAEAEVEARAQELIKDRMREVLYSKSVPTKSELVNAIASVAAKENVENIITYNYDDLIEKELTNTKAYESIYNGTTTRSCGVKPIYHVHGYLPREQQAPGIPVLSETEYHKLYSNMHHWANVVQLNALYTTTCFFIGFSMSDPNQRRLLELARCKDLGSNDSNEILHYIFLRRQQLAGEASKAVNDEHCNEIENMMNNLGLNVIWFDEFKSLPQCLRYVFGLATDKPKMQL